jgi:hypothetical protein
LKIFIGYPGYFPETLVSAAQGGGRFLLESATVTTGEYIDHLESVKQVSAQRRSVAVGAGNRHEATKNLDTDLKDGQPAVMPDELIPLT